MISDYGLIARSTLKSGLDGGFGGSGLWIHGLGFGFSCLSLVNVCKNSYFFYSISYFTLSEVGISSFNSFDLYFTESKSSIWCMEGHFV